MDDISKQILIALFEDIIDGSDGYICFEIIEPYVNANRKTKATYIDIYEKLLILIQENCVEGFERSEKDSEEIYLQTKIRKENFNKLWYRITDKGIKLNNSI